MNKLYVAAALCFFLLIAIVQARSCMRPEARDAFQEAESIFVGKVSEINSGFFANKILFEKEQAWKGDTQKLTLVYTDKSGGGQSMGYAFDKGETYLIYSYKSSSGGKLWVSVCDVKKSVEATEDVEALNALATPIIEFQEETQKPNALKRLFGWFKNIFS